MAIACLPNTWRPCVWQATFAGQTRTSAVQESFFKLFPLGRILPNGNNVGAFQAFCASGRGGSVSRQCRGSMPRAGLRAWQTGKLGLVQSWVTVRSLPAIHFLLFGKPNSAGSLQIPPHFLRSPEAAKWIWRAVLERVRKASRTGQILTFGENCVHAVRILAA